MATIPLLSTDQNHKELYINSSGLPDNYMADFSLMALVVDHYDKAAAIIGAAGFGIEKIHGAAQIHMRHATDILDIKKLLMQNRVECELADIADTLYQA